MANIVIDVEETLNPLSNSKRSVKKEANKTPVVAFADASSDSEAHKLRKKLESDGTDSGAQNKNQT